MGVGNVKKQENVSYQMALEVMNLYFVQEMTWWRKNVMKTNVQNLGLGQNGLNAQLLVAEANVRGIGESFF